MIKWNLDHLNLFHAKCHYNIEVDWCIYTSANYANIGSHKGLLPVRCKATTWTNDGSLLIGPLGTNISAIWLDIQIISFGTQLTFTGLTITCHILSALEITMHFITVSRGTKMATDWQTRYWWYLVLLQMQMVQVGHCLGSQCWVWINKWQIEASKSKCIIVLWTNMITQIMH